MKYLKRGGQISATVLTIIGLLFSASIGVSWNAMFKADKVATENSEIKADVREIKTDVRWLRETLSNQKVLGTIATSSPVNGHR